MRRCGVYIVLLFCVTVTAQLMTETRPCNFFEFLCDDTRCIHLTWVCDGDRDCIDGTDEQENCNTCNDDEFRCDDSRCIPSQYVCDGEDDCEDGSDERQHCKTKACNDDEFRCDDTRCIGSRRVCDGDRDCIDGTDEQENCTGTDTNDYDAAVEKKQEVNALSMRDSTGAAQHSVPDVTVVLNLLKESDINEFRRRNIHDAEHRDPVEIHSRTNALGIPLFVSPLGVLEPVNERRDLLCWRHALGEGRCDWALEGFKWVMRKDYNGEVTSTAPQEGNFKTSFGIKSCSYSCPTNNCDDGYCNIYLLPKEFKNNTTTGYHVLRHFLKVSMTKYGSYFEECSYYSNTTYSFNQLRIARCQNSVTLEVSPISSYYWLEINNDQIIITKEGQQFSSITASTLMDLNEFPNIVVTEADGTYFTAPETFYFQELYTASSEARLTSPLFVANTTPMCLLVVYLSEALGEAEAALAISVRTPELTHSLAEGLHSTTVKKLNFWKIEESLPDEFIGKEVQLVLSALTNQSLYIQRIASCEEKEQVTVISNDLQKNAHSDDFIPRFEIDRDFDVVDIRSSFCANGGVLTTAGCACVAGFTGPNCTRGCGPNSFGQDCGGTCSLYTSECKGKKLCTPGVGCLCATGYTGDLCGTRCDEVNGESAEHYGADCKQQCGHCIDGGCDIYTGKCSECIDGYAPPFCREKYVHTIEPPRLTSTRYGVISVSVNLTKENFQGYGTPKFYQVQYKVYNNYNPYNENNVYTTKLLNGKKEDKLDIEGLSVGQNYTVRIILIADDLVKYEGKDIPEASIMTKCHIPEMYNYNISVNYYDETTATFVWDYKVQENWCPLWKVEMSYKAGWKWRTFEQWWTSRFSLSPLTPNKKIQFRVRAITRSGYAPYSYTLTTVTPRPIGKHPVENLKISSIESGSVKITWDPPKAGESMQVINYTVTYKCTWLVLCWMGCAAEGELTADLSSQTTIELQDLLPSARYRVAVAADHGPPTVTYFGTLPAVPSDIPGASLHKTIRSNSSATVFWEPVVRLCSDVFTAYFYQLFQTSDMTKAIQSGRTQNTNVTFVNLTASTDYVVHVHIETASGWNPNKVLRIEISTDATVPETVRNLTVYKRGRTMMGIRWAEPRLVYGRLHSFTVTYRHAGADSMQSSEIIAPSHCVPWPLLYCHTLEGLRPNIMYNISVSARNENIQDDGLSLSVMEKTKESSPGAPENLKVINITSNSLVLQWKYPNLANGVLRSFLVSVEETEQHMQDHCCQVYPIMETPVREELPYYQLEISELHPASTYSISVAGKTTGFGPSETLSISTQPPPLPLSPPTVETLCSTDLTWLPQENFTEIDNAEVYKNLIRSHIIIVLYNSSDIELVTNKTGIVNIKLKKILKEKISKDFYMVGEYKKGSQIVFGGLYPPPETKNEWGFAYNLFLPLGHNYQLAAVQISEYNGVLNTDIVYSSTFTC